MNYYIPFSLKDGDHSIYDLITSIVGAEGIAPTDASVFNGIETPRSSPALFTGIHPLNPHKDRMIVYDRLPLLKTDGKYAVVHGNAAYICVESDAVKLPAGESLHNVEALSIQGLSVYETTQAIFFSDPSKVDILFVSPAMYEKCQGCRAGVNVKNEKSFGYRVLAQADTAHAITLPDESVDEIAQTGGLTPVGSGTYVPSWRMEALQGAALCYRLVKQSSVASGAITKADTGEADWNRIMQFTEWLGGLRYVDEQWPGREQLSEILSLLRTLPSFVKKGCSLEYFRTDDFGSYDLIHRKLIDRFVDVAVSLKMKRWNWADNECRASLAESIMDLCIVPVMKESFPPDDADKKIDAMASLMLMVERRFRESNTYEDFDESNLNSGFVRALYRFLSSEGRIDRIQEYLGAESHLGLQIREMLAAMYGAFKGYAQISVKRLTPVAGEDVRNQKSPRSQNMVQRWDTRPELIGKAAATPIASATTHHPEKKEDAPVDHDLFGVVVGKIMGRIKQPRRTRMTNGLEEVMVAKDQIPEVEAKGYTKVKKNAKK